MAANSVSMKLKHGFLPPSFSDLFLGKKHHLSFSKHNLRHSLCQILKTNPACTYLAAFVSRGYTSIDVEMTHRRKAKGNLATGRKKPTQRRLQSSSARSVWPNCRPLCNVSRVQRRLAFVPYQTSALVDGLDKSGGQVAAPSALAFTSD